MKIAVIGAGSIGQAIIECMQKHGIKDIIATRRNEEVLSEIKKKYNVETTTDNAAASKNADVVILCVRPDAIDGVAKEIKDVVENKLVISIAAAKKINTIDLDARLARVMTGILVYEELAWFTCEDQDVETLKKIFGENSIRVEENLIDVRSAIGCMSGIKPMIADQEIKELMKFGVDKEILTKTYGAMFSAFGKKMQEGFSGEELFDGCTGGHKGSFTYGLYSSLEPEIKKIKTSLSETVEKMRDPK